MKARFKFYVTRIHVNKSYPQTALGFIRIDLMDPENQMIEKVINRFLMEVEHESGKSLYKNHIALECNNGMYLVFHDGTLVISTEIGSLQRSEIIDCNNKRLAF